MLPNSSHLQSDKTPDFRLDQVKTQGSTIMAILRVFDSIINGRRWLTRVRWDGCCKFSHHELATGYIITEHKWSDDADYSLYIKVQGMFSTAVIAWLWQVAV